MATPLRQLLTSISFDDSAREAFLAEPEQYLADHGWAGLDGADLQVASGALVGELPSEQAIDLHAAVAATGPADHEGGAHYLGLLVEAVHHPPDPVEATRATELNDLTEAHDDGAVEHVVSDDPALALDNGAGDGDPDLGIDTAADLAAGADPDVDLGTDVDLRFEPEPATETTDNSTTETMATDHEPVDELFADVLEPTFDPWSDPTTIDAELGGESDLYPDDPAPDVADDPTDTSSDLDLDL